MSVNSILSRYIARQFLVSFGGLLVILTGLIWLIEFIELVRRVNSQPDGTISQALQLSLLKVPETLNMLFHFAVLFAGMFTFWRLTRSQELIVVRAAGVSVWQFLKPVILVAVALGIIKVTMFNPIGAALQSRFVELENRYIRGYSSILEVSPFGIWLRQETEGGVQVLYAERTEPDRIALQNVIIFQYDSDGIFVDRTDADTAELTQGEWIIEDAWRTIGLAQPEFVGAYRLPTELTQASIENSFAPPDTLSFWDLPEFIDTLEETGFSTVRHRLYFNSLLSQPLMMAVMILFAAAFSLRVNTRRGGGTLMVLAGLTTAFSLFVLNDVVFALGLAETIPTVLAAWTPAGVSMLIAIATLLHMEDG
ncbi:MAG: LPS export ABC transporter permease LptG [Pseudomonadota bacterium]